MSSKRSKRNRRPQGPGGRGDENPAAAQGSRKLAMLRSSLNWLAVAIATTGCGLGCYLLYDGLATGTTTSLNKFGSHHTYSMQLQQGKYWLTMAGHLVTTLLLAAVALVSAKLRRYG